MKLCRADVEGRQLTIGALPAACGGSPKVRVEHQDTLLDRDGKERTEEWFQVDAAERGGRHLENTTTGPIQEDAAIVLDPSRHGGAGWKIAIREDLIVEPVVR